VNRFLDYDSLTGSTLGPLAGLRFGLTPQGWWARSLGGTHTDYVLDLTPGDINAPARKAVAADAWAVLSRILDRAKTDNPLTWVPGSRFRYGTEGDWEEFQRQADFLGYRDVLTKTGEELTLQGATDSYKRADDYRFRVTAHSLDTALRSLWLRLVAAQGRGERIMLPEVLYRAKLTGAKTGSFTEDGGVQPPRTVMWTDLDFHGAKPDGYEFLDEAAMFDLLDIGLDHLVGGDIDKVIVQSGGGMQAYIRHARIDDSVRQNFSLFLRELEAGGIAGVDWRVSLRHLPVRVWGSYRVKGGDPVLPVEVRQVWQASGESTENPFARLTFWADTWRSEASEAAADAADDGSVLPELLERMPVTKFKLERSGELVRELKRAEAIANRNADEDDALDERPGSRFRRTVTAFELLDALHGADRRGDRVYVVRPDGRLPQDSDASVLVKYDDEGYEIETVYFHSDNGPESCGLKGGRGRGYDSYQLLAAACGDGDMTKGFKLATAVLHAFGDKYAEIPAFIRKNGTAKDIRKALPKRPRPRTRPLTLEERFDAAFPVERFQEKKPDLKVEDGQIILNGESLTASQFVLKVIARGDAARARTLMEKIA
jgi:hypothetical protein